VQFQKQDKNRLTPNNQIKTRENVMQSRHTRASNHRHYRSRLLGLLIFVISTVVLLQSCAVGPDYIEPAPSAPDRWHQNMVRGLSDGQANLQTWWTIFNDPLLNDIIERARKRNLDLKEAFARIQEARARRGFAKGQFYPDINGGGFWQRARESGDFNNLNRSNRQTDNYAGVGMDGSWEIDAWGRIRRSVESADAGLQASVENYRDILVILLADVASNYTEVRTLQERIRFVKSNIGTQEGSLGITKARFKAQLTSQLDVRQAELNLARTESLLPRLQAELVQAINRIGVLLGEYPSALYDELITPAPLPEASPQTLVGLPSDIIRQRPDIRRAERQLAEQNAKIGVATAELYPTFGLGGTIGLSATTNIFDSDNKVWSLGPFFRWNIFDGGRVRARINIEDARTQQAYASYERTILEALEDVENSMTGYTRELDRRDALRRSVVAAQKSVELVNIQYKTGLTDFQNVLDMERSQFEQQDFWALSRGLVIQNLISIYRSMGGGWQPQPEKLVQEISDQETRREPLF
jgi:NodT family efflux transporter outer membrane factor (OMF) lipoprotein